MACEETTQLLSQFIDDVLSTPARAAVDEHLDRCPVCRARVAMFYPLLRAPRLTSISIVVLFAAPALLSYAQLAGACGNFLARLRPLNWRQRLLLRS